MARSSHNHHHSSQNTANFAELLAGILMLIITKAIEISLANFAEIKIKYQSI